MKEFDQEQLKKSGNTIFPIISLWGFSRVVSGQIWPNFNFLRGLLHITFSCKYEKDRMKNSWENMATWIF